MCLFPNGALIRELRVREYKLERDESTTSFLIFLGRPLSDLAPYDPFPVLRRPSAADETLPLSKHSCHGIHFMLRFVRSLRYLSTYASYPSGYGSRHDVSRTQLR